MVCIGLTPAWLGPTWFSVPWLLVGYLFQATAPISSAVLPMAARVEAESGRDRLADLYTRASRGMLALALAAAVPLAFYAGDFLAHFGGEPYRAVAPVLMVLLVGEVFRVGQITGLHLGRHDLSGDPVLRRRRKQRHQHPHDSTA